MKNVKTTRIRVPRKKKGRVLRVKTLPIIIKINPVGNQYLTQEKMEAIRNSFGDFQAGKSQCAGLQGEAFEIYQVQTKKEIRLITSIN